MTNKNTKKNKGVILLWLVGILLITGIISGIYLLENESKNKTKNVTLVDMTQKKQDVT